MVTLSKKIYFFLVYLTASTTLIDRKQQQNWKILDKCFLCSPVVNKRRVKKRLPVVLNSASLGPLGSESYATQCVVLFREE